MRARDRLMPNSTILPFPHLVRTVVVACRGFPSTQESSVIRSGRMFR